LSNYLGTVGVETMRYMRIGLIIGLLLVASTAGADSFEHYRGKVDGKIVQVVSEDINGDGFTDLIVSYRKGLPPGAQPCFAVFLFSPEGFQTKPDLDVPAPWDTCLFDIADLNGDGRIELVLFRKWKVQKMPLFGDQAGQASTILSRSSGAMFPPYSAEVQYENLVRDWLGDGTPVLALPDYGALRFFRVSGDESESISKVNLPVRGWLRATGTAPPGLFRYQVHSGVETPAIFLGPKRPAGRDLVLTSREELWFHRSANGGFQTKGKRFYFPILTDDERSQDNMSMLTLVDDLDGDGFPEAVLNKYGGSLTAFRSAIHIHAGVDGGFVKKPGYTHKASGYSAMLRFWDVDGDGKKEMLMPTADIGLVQIARVLLSQKVKVTFKMFRCQGAVGAGMYAAEPDFTREVVYDFDPDTGMLVGFHPGFEGDFNGDGRPDLFMEYGEGFGVWDNRGNLQFGQTPYAVGNVPPCSYYHVDDLNNDKKADVFMWESNDPQRQNEVVVLLNVS